MSRTLSVEFARDVEPDGLEPFLLSLRSLLASGRFAGNASRAAIELRGDRDGVTFSLWLERDAIIWPVAEALRAAFPASRVVEAEPRDPGDEVSAFARLTLGHSTAPLRGDLPRPGLAGILTPLGGLRGDQLAIVQIALAPAPPSAQARLLGLARRQERRSAASSLPGALAQIEANRPRARATRSKAETPLFRASALIAASEGRLVRDVAAGFGPLAAPYAGVRYHRVFWAARAREQLRRRALPLFPSRTLVGAAELAVILAPTPEVLRAARGPILSVREVAPPPAVGHRGRVLCVAEARGRERGVAVNRADSRLHLALIGPTGTGKTTVQTNYFLEAIRSGDGGIYLEPKGDAIEEVLRRLPTGSEPVVVDPVRDPEHPVGLNLLERAQGQDAAAVARSVLSVIRALNERSWGARLEDTAYNGLLTAASVPGTTIAELPAIYASDTYRGRFVSAVEDPYVRDFWRWFEHLSAAERATITAPVLNKLRPLLRPELLAIVAQPKSTIDLDRVLAERKVLLVRIPPGGELFGALLVSRIWQAIGRCLALREERRTDAVLCIDEVASFLRTGGDVAEMLAMARGARVSVCLATQHLGQCPPDLRAALLANARTRLCFQTTYPDAETLARDLGPELEATDLLGLGRYEVAARVAVDGATSRPFIARTLPLPEPERSSTEQLRARSRKRYGHSRHEVLADLEKRLCGASVTEADALGGIGRRPAS